MAKKLDINGIVQPSVDRQYVDYQMGMSKYNRGLKDGVYTTGSVDAKRDFAELALETRITGATVAERMGKSLPVPALEADNGRVTWGTEMTSKEMLTKQSGVERSSENNLSRYERAARVLGVDLSEDSSKDADEEFGK